MNESLMLLAALIALLIGPDDRQSLGALQTQPGPLDRSPQGS